MKNLFDCELFGKSWFSNTKQMQNSIDSAEHAFREIKQLLLYKMAKWVEETSKESSQYFSKEAEKPISLAREEAG